MPPKKAGINNPKPAPEFDVEYVEDYGALVRRAREAMGLSQSELALKVKTKGTIIKKIEQGEFNPPIDLARRLERALKISILQESVEEAPKTPAKQPPPSGYTLEDLLKSQQKKGPMGVQ
ncbi:MAG: helix-turn-helix domain-containing protein [Nitrososphaerota archaeon]